MNETMTIVLPLPPKSLSPNRPVMTRGGRILKAQVTKKYRKQAADAAAQVQLVSGPWARALGLLKFYWPDERRRDIRNAEASMKAAYDGIVDAGVIIDDDAKTLQHEPTLFKVDRAAPRVEITITRIEP